jgi:anthranilate synthase component 1
MKLHTKPTDLDQDPLAVFERLAGSHDYCFLMETLADKYQPQSTSQSYIGIAPEQHFAARPGEFLVDGRPQPSENAYQALRRQIKFADKTPKGYAGGLVGYFSHEAIHYIEPSLEFPYPREFFDFEFARYNDGLIFKPGAAPEYFYYDEDRLTLYQAEGPKPAKLSISFKGEAKNSGQYDQMIDKARNDIQNGRVFQVVLANKYEYDFSGDLLALYKEMRRVNPSPFMFFMKFGDTITLGASPELLVHTNAAGGVYLEALAGTIKRGKSNQEDAELAAELLADEKEIAEHSMLVDLARNDLGRISKIGSVKIDDLMYIKKLSHVQHISSIVSGRLKPGSDAFDALAASFPAGTLSGAPKIEAIKMIAAMEGYERGPYGGTIGYFSYNGDSVHAVNIRSVCAVGSKLVLHSGSGIIYDSQASREYQEVRDKKAAMDRAMRPFLTEAAEEVS